MFQWLVAFGLVSSTAFADPQLFASPQFKRWYAATISPIIDTYSTDLGSAEIDQRRQDLDKLSKVQQRYIRRAYRAWQKAADNESLEHLNPLSTSEALEEERKSQRRQPSKINRLWRTIAYVGKMENIEIAVIGLVKYHSPGMYSSSFGHLTVILTDSARNLTTIYSVEATGDISHQHNLRYEKIYFRGGGNIGFNMNFNPKGSQFITLAMNIFGDGGPYTQIEVPIKSVTSEGAPLHIFEDLVSKANPSLKTTWIRKGELVLTQQIRYLVKENASKTPICERIFLIK